MKKSILIAALISSSFAFAQVPQVPQGVQDATSGAIEKGAASPEAKSLVKQAGEKALVHINSASPEDLAKLPGIGPARAKAIIDGRPYSSIQDLKKIKGIKEAVFAKIKGMIAL